MGRLILAVMLLNTGTSLQAKDFAFLAKGGAVKLGETVQTLEDTGQRVFDDTSRQTFSFAWEVRHPIKEKHHITFGLEYIHYVHDFAPIAGISGPAEAETRAHILTVKYYHGPKPWRPYLGLGVGRGETKVTQTFSEAPILDDSIAIQGLIGVEFLRQYLGYYAEIKYLAYEPLDYSPRAYDAGGVGVFVGLSGIIPLPRR